MEDFRSASSFEEEDWNEDAHTYMDWFDILPDEKELLRGTLQNSDSFWIGDWEGNGDAPLQKE